MTKYSNAYSEILDYLYDRVLDNTLPVTIDSDDVEWIYTTPKGDKYGITNVMAQAIKCICNRHGHNPFNEFGGKLDYVQGGCFSLYTFHGHEYEQHHIDL